MFFLYQYQGKPYRLLVNWTSAEGKSTVFRDVTQKTADRHRFEADGYMALAKRLDALTDKLYRQIDVFADDHFSVPYDPRFRKRIITSFSEIGLSVRSCAVISRQQHEILLATLFEDVADKLREIVDVYLEEHAYRCKYRERMRDSEQYIEMTPPIELSYEFEDVLLQMTEISRHMDCLSEVERRLLVKHVFLKYTFREIAHQEGMSRYKAHKSVSGALKRIKGCME